MARLLRALLILSAIAASWAVVVGLSGGFVVYVGPIRVSSRSPRNAALIALVTGVVAWGMAPPAIRRQWLGNLGRWSRSLASRWPRWCDPAAIVALVAIGVEISLWASARPLWLDEEMIALNIRERPLAGLAGPLWFGQGVPLGWLVLQRAVVLSLGTSEHALRLVPLLWTCAAIVAAVWVGRRWMGAVGAAALVLLCVAGPTVAWYALEVKPYSSDLFWGLLLPALAAWTTEADGSTRTRRRAVVWWTAAAIGQWFANGALLVVPGCALVLLVIHWRRGGMRAAMVFAAPSVVWLALCALHYVTALRHIVNSDYLRSYWAFAMPPPSAGVAGTLEWLAAQLEPFADQPVGARRWVLFWILATCGLAFSRSPVLLLLLAGVPVSAAVLASLRLVPLFERLSIWVVPALYISLAFVVDATVRFGRVAVARRSAARAAPAAILAVALVALGIDLFTRGNAALQSAGAAENHLLDDRAAVRWIMRHRGPGDAIMTTQLALPAIWWYGSIPLGGPAAGRRAADGGAILAVAYEPEGRDCSGDTIREALGDARRVLVYFGFRFDDVPKGFDDLLLTRLGESGTIGAAADFGSAGRAVLFHLRGRGVPARSRQPRGADAKPLSGCLVVQPAARW